MVHLYRLALLWLLAGWLAPAHALVPQVAEWVCDGYSASTGQAACELMLNSTSGSQVFTCEQTGSTSTSASFYCTGNLGGRRNAVASKVLVCPANSSPSGGSCSCNSGYTEAGGACVAPNPDRDACASFALTQTLPGGALVQDYRLQGNVQHGAEFCMQGAFDSPSKGCKVTFNRGAYLDYGGAASVTEGTFSMASNASTVDQSCAVGDGNTPPKVPPKEKCPNGYSGTVNGVEVCINKVPDSGADGGREVEEENNGTESRRVTRDTHTECKNGICTTTTTTTTTVTNNSTGASSTTTTTSTSTKPQAGFCQANPKSKLCSDGDDDGSSFSGTCGSGFKCEGDAIQCAIAQEQHRRACKLFDDKSPESELYEAEKAKGKDRDVTATLPGNETIDVGSKLSRENLLGGAACVSDLNVTVWGQSLSLPISSVCPALGYLGYVLVTVASLAAFRIVSGTSKED